MKQAEIKGIIPAILTPMNEDESINLDVMPEQIDRLIDGGVHGLFPFGTNGEGYILNEKEKDIIIKHMWPVTIEFPKSIEGFILTFVDKYCALSESLDILKSRLFTKKAIRYTYAFMSLLIIKL